MPAIALQGLRYFPIKRGFLHYPFQKAGLLGENFQASYHII